MGKPAVNVGPAGNHYDKYASTNPIERRMMQQFLASFDSMMGGLRPLKVLEVGVGEGEILQRVARRFPDASVQGIDLPADHLQEEWTRRGITAEFGDATSLRFDDGEFDLVLAIEVLEHIPQPERAIAEIARVCKGHVVLSVPREPIWRIGNILRGRYISALGNTPGHVNHWSSKAFQRTVRQFFTIEQASAPLPWTMVRATSNR
jgi:2-polyprenyl-3-methyl-5-hydroxy-6-metoxy-1,4-benzoquinol methylase